MWVFKILLSLFLFMNTLISYTFSNRIHSRSLTPLHKYDKKYIEVPVDHFNFANQDTFKLRYLINDENWNPESGGPIFFYTGNEADITLFAENTGFIWELAPEFKALIVFAEHRYYGESLPYGNNSFSDAKHYGYLTVEQTLADFVDLVTYLRSHQDGKHRKLSPVIAIGGSYGGMLAAWFRLKYPAVIVGSLASSAPIWLLPDLMDCEGVYRVTTSIYEVAHRNCADNIKHIWKEINNITTTGEGRSWLSKNWTLCQPLKAENYTQGFKMWLKESFLVVAMANYPYPTEFLGHFPGNPVKELCEHLKTANLRGKELLGSVSNGLRAVYNYSGKAKCLDWSTVGPTTFDSRGWNFQACTQLVMPVCSNGVNDMFEPQSWNIVEYLIKCEQQFKVKPRPYFITKQYGGKHLETSSNIIFSNGLLDPYSSGGVMSNVSNTSIAVLIPEGAHQFDLRESNQLDPDSVQVARKYYKQIFNEWIIKFREHY
ncbi:lysosomal Pro-X carboxypeptidase-like [Lycorma delicatula]|uniref:lysosomal Pro-X carboxypeptidase-like n=1 Tax=Lycorma delicatula TaxID=130591 RepID=UPI003F5157E4